MHGPRSDPGKMAMFDGTSRSARRAVAIRDRSKRAGLPIRGGAYAVERALPRTDGDGVALPIGARILARLDRTGSLLPPPYAS